MIFSAVLEEYAKLYAGYKIDLLCQPKVRDLAVAVPYLNDVFCIDPFKVGRKKYFPYYFYILCVLNLKGYEKIIYPVYSRTIENELIIQHIRSKEKITCEGNNSNDPNDERFARNRNFTKIIPSDPGEKPEIERNAEFLTGLGGHIKEERLNPKIWFRSQDQISANKILSDHNLKQKEYFCIFPGAGFDIRWWDHSSWIELIGKLTSRYPEFKIVLLGFGRDIIPIQAIIDGLSVEEKARVVNLYSKTRLRALAKILQWSRFCIGMETGATHIAAAVDAPYVCLIGGGHFGRFYPYGDLSRNRIVYHKMDCYGCNWRCIYDVAKCIKNIKTDDVFGEVQMLMNTSSHTISHVPL